MRVLILGGTQFVGRHIVEALLAAGHRVSILAGPRLTWAEFMRVLGAENFVWVASEIIASAGLTFLDLPLYRPERGARSSLMDVSNERARTAGLTLTDPAVTASDVCAWLRGRNLPPALSREREAELIRLAREQGM